MQNFQLHIKTTVTFSSKIRLFQPVIKITTKWAVDKIETIWFRASTGDEGTFSLAPFDFDYILFSFVGDRSLSRKIYKEKFS
jgi:hypothetical protein